MILCGLGYVYLELAQQLYRVFFIISLVKGVLELEDIIPGVCVRACVHVSGSLWTIFEKTLMYAQDK